MRLISLISLLEMFQGPFDSLSQLAIKGLYLEFDLGNFIKDFFFGHIGS